MCDVSGPPSKTNAKANKWTYDGLPATKNLSQNSYSDNIAATQSTIVVCEGIRPLWYELIPFYLGKSWESGSANAGMPGL